MFSVVFFIGKATSSPYFYFRFIWPTDLESVPRVRPNHPRCRSATWLCMCGHTRDPVIYSKFHRNPFKGFETTGGQTLALPITLASRFYNSLYYRTSRDVQISHTRTVVRECCKDDDQCQWERPKFDPPPHLNPLTDRHQNLPT